METTSLYAGDLFCMVELTVSPELLSIWLARTTMGQVQFSHYL